MDILNSKITSTQDDTKYTAQNVGLYGYDEGVSQWRRLKTNADGALNVDVEINTGGLNLETTQVLVKNAVETGLMDINNTGGVGDGQTMPNIICSGYDRSNGQGRSLLVDSGGILSVADSAGKTAQEVGTMDINNTGTIGDGQSCQTRMSLGYDRTAGQGRSMLVDSEGGISTVLTGNTNAAGSGTKYHITCDAGGRMYINSDIGIPIKPTNIKLSFQKSHLNCPFNWNHTIRLPIPYIIIHIRISL